MKPAGWIALGIAIGAGIGAATGDIGVWVGVGIVYGAAMMVFARRKRERSERNENGNS